MKTKNRIILGVAFVALAAIATYAGAVASKTFRTDGYFIGIIQGTNAVTENPQYDFVDFNGHNLVNLTMGREANDRSDTNQVMAMTFACDLSSASLVVFDKSSNAIVATIAESTSVNSVKQQDPKAKGPNHAHFVGAFQLIANGNTRNAVLGGNFEVAGRVNTRPDHWLPGSGSRFT